MGKTTEISWCHHTMNPWWGCQRWSPGCEQCYAETLARRWGHNIWGPAKTTPRRMMSDAYWRQPITWDAAAKAAGERRRVFCASMADVFEDHPQLPPMRRRLWNLIEETPNLDWLLLTKRPENIATMLPSRYWPNVWLGTSTEDQQRADERVPVLLRYRDRVPVLFLSVEPMLGQIDAREFMWPVHPRWRAPYRSPEEAIAAGAEVTYHRQALVLRGTPFIDWVIVGGESGPRHRPFDIDWARSLRDQCQVAGVAFHFKQHGGRTHAEGGCLLDGREWKEFPESRRELTLI